MAKCQNDETLTPVRIEVLRIVHQLWSRGYGPTQAEIAAARGRSTVTINDAIQTLVRGGWLVKSDAWARAISLSEKGACWIAAHPA